MKKTYQKPYMQVAEIGVQQLFAASFQATKATNADEVGVNRNDSWSGIWD